VAPRQCATGDCLRRALRPEAQLPKGSGLDARDFNPLWASRALMPWARPPARADGGRELDAIRLFLTPLVPPLPRSLPDARSFHFLSGGSPVRSIPAKRARRGDYLHSAAKIGWMTRHRCVRSRFGVGCPKRGCCSMAGVWLLAIRTDLRRGQR